jgi:hypothetical protein
MLCVLTPCRFARRYQRFSPQDRDSMFIRLPADLHGVKTQKNNIDNVDPVLFICDLFNDAVSSSDCVASNDE